ncbi:MAG: hypothetical protein QN173_02875 [Armatimonadota bacterium]|nr:hypothetical protein [Armatimonadota bacterium]MDR7437778.1 hypothetical protein [Armatimonadota bacterium]MDR7473259.1 hypothetical protein [Armatimonadota bacterium]MDR7506532.1 hypothetical protein [Armatimonadota bacterium]MDR7510315.1 hypothetical protein [Armatimonadota bacterium]
MDVSLVVILGTTLPAVVWILSLRPRTYRVAPASKEEVLSLWGVRWPEKTATDTARALGAAD